MKMNEGDKELEVDETPILNFISIINNCKINDLQQDFKTNDCLLNLIGAGRYSVVYLMENTKFDRKETFPLLVEKAIMKISGFPFEIEGNLPNEVVKEYKECYNDDNKCSPVIEALILCLFNKMILEKNLSPCVPKFYGIFSHKSLLPTKEFMKNNETYFNIYKTHSREKIISDGTSNLDETDTYNFFKRHMQTKRVIDDNTTYVTFAEYADEKDLNKWIENLWEDDEHSMYVLLVLIFHIVFTYGHIHLLFPNFVHRDLHLGNVLIKTDPNYEKGKNKVYLMSYKGIVFQVPCIPYIAMVWDFEFSDIIGKTNNMKMIDNAIEGSNRFYDLNCFFSYLKLKLTSIVDLNYSKMSLDQQLEYDLLLNTFLDNINPSSLTFKSSFQLNEKEKEMHEWSCSIASDEEKIVKKAIQDINNFGVHLVGARLQTNIEHVTADMLMSTKNLLTRFFFEPKREINETPIITGIYGDVQDIEVLSKYCNPRLEDLNMSIKNASLLKSLDTVNYFFRNFIEDTITIEKVILTSHHVSKISQCLVKEIFPHIYNFYIRTWDEGNTNDTSLIDNLFDIFKSNYKVERYENIPYFNFNTKGVQTQIKDYLDCRPIPTDTTPTRIIKNFGLLKFFDCYSHPSNLVRLEERRLFNKKRYTEDDDSLSSISFQANKKQRPGINGFSDSNLFDFLKSNEVLL